MNPQLSFTAVSNIPLIRPGDDLAQIAFDRMRESDVRLQDGDVVVFAQKVVSKSEGRLVRLSDVTPSPAAVAIAAATSHNPALVEVVLRESNEILKIRQGLLIVEQRTGFICANAGVDRSNIEPENGDTVVSLLPADPDASARYLCDRLCRLSGARVAVLIIDTHGRAFRNGVIGTAIGVAGMKPLRDARGEIDLFGYALQHTIISTADELAAGASLLMGQSAEGLPVVVVRGARYEPGDGSIRELMRQRELDLFRPEPIRLPSAATGP